MEKILTFHTSILKEIQKIIEQKYKINADHIRPDNFSIIDDRIMKFQLSFEYPFSNPMQKVSLSFELRDSSHQTLYFETLAGFKGYEKSNNYHGLEGEILKYIDNNLDQQLDCWSPERKGARSFISPKGNDHENKYPRFCDL